MNKRIQELALQAGEYARKYVADCKHYGYYMEHNEYDLQFEQKFAELIVKECIEQGDTLAKHYINTHTEQDQAMLLAAIADYSKEIEKHFGVK